MSFPYIQLNVGPGARWARWRHSSVLAVAEGTRLATGDGQLARLRHRLLVSAGPAFQGLGC